MLNELFHLYLKFPKINSFFFPPTENDPPKETGKRKRAVKANTQTKTKQTSDGGEDLIEDEIKGMCNHRDIMNRRPI